jgi:hypothetical protein
MLFFFCPFSFAYHFTIGRPSTTQKKSFFFFFFLYTAGAARGFRVVETRGIVPIWLENALGIEREAKGKKKKNKEKKGERGLSAHDSKR